MTTRFKSCDWFAQTFEVSKMTVLRMIRDGRLKAVKVGSQWRIPISELAKFGIEVPNED